MENFIVDEKWVKENYYGEADFTIPDGAVAIDEKAFADCESLTSIHIPDSVTEIGERAFYECENLTSVNIPDSVTEIEVCAFLGCKSLASINIPDSVNEIGRFAFACCNNLTIICSKDSYAEEYAKEHNILVEHPRTPECLIVKMQEITERISALQSELNECIALQSELNKCISGMTTIKTEENHISAELSKEKKNPIEHGDN